MIRRHARARSHNNTRTRTRARERVWSSVASAPHDLRESHEHHNEQNAELTGASER